MGVGRGINLDLTAAQLVRVEIVGLTCVAKFSSDLLARPFFDGTVIIFASFLLG